MQEAIEKKIEKFSSQNMNVQKRVNTSSKFRNNHNTLIPINPAPALANPVPTGTTQGNGAQQFHNKKYSINNSFTGDEGFKNEGGHFISPQNAGVNLQHISPPQTLRNI